MTHPNSKRAKAAKAKRKRQRASEDAAPDRDARRAQSQQRRAETQARGRRQARLKRVRKVVATAALALLVVSGAWLALRPGPEIAGVERPIDNGRGHIEGATFASATPTSGSHAAQAPACGVYRAQLDLELAVHALEHGVVVLWFDEAQPALGSELAAAADQWDSHVIVSPSSALDAPVVATAWNRRLSFDDVGIGVDEFVDTYRNRGPERVGCANA